MREEVRDSFDEISPITGRMTVLTEDSLRVDLETGYQNLKDIWTVDNTDVISQMEETMPAYILPFKVIDETKNIWYPILAFKHSGVLFPIADPGKGFKWAVSEVEKLTNQEDMNTHYVVNLPILVNGKEEMGLFKVHNDPIQIFEHNEFELAFDLYNSLGNETEK